jgi:thiol:disulfide interchange protein DsbD
MRLALVLIATVALGATHAPAAPDPVSSTMKVAGGKAVVEMTIAPGWHVQSHDPGDKFLIPTTLDVTPPAGQRAGAVEYPPAVEKALEFADGKKLRLYEGRVTLAVPLEGAATDAGPVRAKLRYQACDDTTCLAPKTVELTAEPPAKAPPGTSGAAPTGGEQVAQWIERWGWGGTLAWVVLLGVALNLTPCVYPLISVTVAFFGGTTGHARGAGVRAVVYVAGICLTFTALGAIAALTGSLFGAALQQPAVLGGIAALMVALALSNFGLYQLRLPTGLVQRASRTGEGALGAFVMGLTMGVVAAPCIGPIVVALLLYVGARQSIAEGLALFFALGLGLGLPYLALALLAEKMRRLPRSGAWLEWMEWLFGFLLLGLALHFVTPLLSPAVVAGAWACLLIVAGFVLGFLGSVRRPAIRWARGAAGLLVIVAGLGMLDVKRADAPGIDWTAFSEDALRQARAAGRPVLIDFQATWCLPCREMEHTTFRDPAVVEAARAFTTLKADVTEQDDGTSELLTRFNVPGVPTYVLLDARGEERRRFVGFVAAPDFREALSDVAAGARHGALTGTGNG